MTKDQGSGETVREEIKIIIIIFKLRQWDAESGVIERDQRVECFERDEKECLEHIEKLEYELLKYRNVSLVERVSGSVLKDAAYLILENLGSGE